VIPKKETGVYFLWFQIGAKSRIERLRRTVISASKQIDETGAELRIGMDAAMALGKEIDDRQSMGRERMGTLIEDGRSASADGFVQSFLQSYEIGKRFGIALHVAGQKVSAGKLMNVF